MSKDIFYKLEKYETKISKININSSTFMYNINVNLCMTVTFCLSRFEDDMPDIYARENIQAIGGKFISNFVHH